MKIDRKEFMNRLDTQDKEIGVYRDELAMAKIKMEADINFMFQDQNVTINATQA